MKILLAALAVLIVTVVSTLVSFLMYQRAPVVALATPVCSGPADARQRVLVVGDSWVDGGNVDAAMAGTARVCSVSYSGLTGQDVLQSFTADRDARDAVLADLGHVTDAVMLVGVNDVIQHRGAAYYADGVKRLAEHLSTLADRVVVLELPATQVAAGVLLPPMEVITTLFACLNDWCARDVTTPYRAAAASLPITLIDYDRLAPRFAPGDFEADGIHLTPQRYADLGRIIADAALGPR